MAQKKQQSLCAAPLHKPKCLQKSLKLYKWVQVQTII